MCLHAFNALCLVVVLSSPLVTHSQSVHETLTVEGEVRTPLKLSIRDLKKFAPIETTARDKEGVEHAFKGVRMFDVLDSAGVTLGKELRGENLAKYILVKALDGYEVIFALPEIDPEFTDQTILLAYEVDGKLLPKGEGPFRLIVPEDKKHARWIREISAIKVMFTKG